MSPLLLKILQRVPTENNEIQISYHDLQYPTWPAPPLASPAHFNNYSSTKPQSHWAPFSPLGHIQLTPPSGPLHYSFL